MMMQKLLAGLMLSMCFAAVCFGATDDIVVFPDSFEIANEDGRPFISVTDGPEGITARFRYVSSYKNSTNILKARLGEEYYNKNIIKVNVIPKKIDFISELFLESGGALIRSQIDFQLNSIAVEAVFNEDYSAHQIREMILFPFSIGSIDVTTVWQGSISVDGGEQDLKRLPLINQFSTEFDPQKLIYYQHYSFLRSYAAHQSITSAPFLSEAFSAIIKQNYFANGNCAAADSIYSQDACEISHKYSSAGSIRDAVIFLAEQLYTEDFFTQNLEYFIFNGESLNIKRINLNIDFERIRSELNNGYYIEQKDEPIDITIPLLEDIRIDNRVNFKIKPNSLFWHDYKITLCDDLHFGAVSRLKFSFLGQAFSVPVQYDLSGAFSYDPISETVDSMPFKVTNLEFTNKNGIGYDLASTYVGELEQAINLLLSTEKQVEYMNNKIRSICNYLKDQNIGFTPLL